ncbi:MAG: hypothetical protein ACRD6B_21155, partial [Bryobacteraceae bacterium]
MAGSSSSELIAFGFFASAEKYRLTSYFKKVPATAMKAFLVFFTLTTCLFAAPTTAQFQSTSTSIGPFPSNVLTVPDPAQATGLRVNLPPDSTPACDPASSPAVCGYQTMLNQLDGFSVNPRLMACFSGPVNAAS